MKKQLLAIVSLSVSAFAYAQNCTELFFSEYVEGAGNNKAVEIYNPTGAPINLSNYRVVRFSNGSATGVDSVALTGTVAANDVFVLVNGQTTSTPTSPACDPLLQALADQLSGAYPDPMYMNGNDALALVKITPYTRVDIFGKIGEDPGQSWSDVFPYTDAQGAWWTKDHTLQRKSTVEQGVTVNPSAFNVTTEWDSLPKDTWTGLGSHACACAVGIKEVNKDLVKLSLFPNPSKGQINLSSSHLISGVTVYNTVGARVFDEQYAISERSKQEHIDLSSMSAGLYMVEVKFENGQRLVSKVNVQ